MHFAHHYKTHSNIRGNNVQCLCNTVYNDYYDKLCIHNNTVPFLYTHNYLHDSIPNAVTVVLSAWPWNNQGKEMMASINTHTYGLWTDKGMWRIQFNMWVSFLTAKKIIWKYNDKNCADFFLFHIPREYLNKFLSLITMHVNKLMCHELNRF